MIQRYDMEEPFATKMLRIPNGEYVKYEDHEAELKKAFEAGRKQGVVEGSNEILDREFPDFGRLSR